MLAFPLRQPAYQQDVEVFLLLPFADSFANRFGKGGINDQRFLRAGQLQRIQRGMRIRNDTIRQQA
ncbi:hypothetical protein D3C75_997080 [compost metagenome]